MHQEKLNKPPLGGAVRRQNTVKNGHEPIFPKQNAVGKMNHHRPDLHVNT